MNAAANLSPAKLAAPSFAMLAPAAIAPDPDQPRKVFDEDALAELADSISAHGIIEPIIVRPAAQLSLMGGITHTLIAGERRWRASQLAGLDQLPCIIRTDLAGESLAVVQVLENLQRADLTLPETATGVAQLVQSMGTAKTAKQLGKSEGWVSKHARLGDLPEVITDCINAGTLTSADMAHDLKRLLDIAQELYDLGWAQNLRAAAISRVQTGTMTRAYLRDLLEQIKDVADRRKGAQSSAPEAPAQPAKTVGAELPLEGGANQTNRGQDAYQPSEAQRQADAQQKAKRTAWQQRIKDLEALKPAAQTITTELYVGLCGALGIAECRAEGGAIYPAGDDSFWTVVEPPSIHNGEPIPPPDQAHTLPVCIGLYLTQPQTRRLIAALPGILPEPSPPPEAKEPPTWLDWCAHHLVAEDGARIQCTDVYAAYNATQPERVIRGPAARWSPSDTRWGKRAEAAGLTKKRLKTGLVFTDVKFAGAAE